LTVPPNASENPQRNQANPASAPTSRTLPRLLITAGPTHEPIDQVRYIGNRSSGRLGIALADEAARQGWSVSLLLGPTSRTPTDSRVRLIRFQSTADLQARLSENFPNSDVLIMAAAVADYRPRLSGGEHEGKLKRSASGLTLELEATPDLLAGCAASKRTGAAPQFVVGFALEPRSRLIESGRAKLARKQLDMIVANPLETMDSTCIDATVMTAAGATRTTDGAIEKERFAAWLLSLITAARSGASAGA